MYSIPWFSWLPFPIITLSHSTQLPDPYSLAQSGQNQVQVNHSKAKGFRYLCSYIPEPKGTIVGSLLPEAARRSIFLANTLGPWSLQLLWSWLFFGFFSWRSSRCGNQQCHLGPVQVLGNQTKRQMERLTWGNLCFWAVGSVVMETWQLWAVQGSGQC